MLRNDNHTVFGEVVLHANLVWVFLDASFENLLRVNYFWQDEDLLSRTLYGRRNLDFAGTPIVNDACGRRCESTSDQILVIIGECQEVDTFTVGALENLLTLQGATVPHVDGGGLAELSTGYQVASFNGDCNGDDFELVLKVEPLLTDVRVEQDNDTGCEVNDLFVDAAGLLFVFVDGTSTFSCVLAHRVLQRPPSVVAPDTIRPLKLCFDLIWHIQVVIDGFTLESIGDNWLESCVQPCTEVNCASIAGQVSRSFAHESGNFRPWWESLVLLAGMLFENNEFVVKQRFLANHLGPFHPEDVEEKSHFFGHRRPFENLRQCYSDSVMERRPHDGRDLCFVNVLANAEYF